MKLIKMTIISLLSVSFVTACGMGEQGREDDVAIRRVADNNQNTIRNGGSNADNGGNALPGNGTTGDEGNIVGDGGIGGNGGQTGENDGLTGGMDGTGGQNGGTNGTNGGVDGNEGLTGGTDGTAGQNGGAIGGTGGALGGNGDGEYTADDEGNVNGDNGDIRIADKAQNKVEKLKEVSHASVIVVNDKAYVGVLMDKHAKGGLTEDIKKKISKEVKATDKNVKKVYTSSNPDVIERMGEYGDRLQGSQPVQGISGEFTQAMQKFFPNA